MTKDSLYIIDYIMDPAVPEQAVPVPDRTGCPNTGTGKMEYQEQGSGTGFWPGTQKRSCTISALALLFISLKMF